ncbi:MAG: methyltransferase [Pseudomonas sp.]|uniref:methyltransferase n=1 Tax=Pseudomonas sp. TaxID=306 RepID=UPI0033940DA0
MELILPAALLAACRHVFLLLPLAATLWLAASYRQQPRILVAALFALLYQGGVLLALNILAISLGWWRFDDSVLVLLGFPADLWFGWALIWGPLFFLLTPRRSPWLWVPLLVLLDLLLMPSLQPLVVLGPDWLQGRVLLLLAAYLPGQYLARWTAEDRRLPRRAALLAIAYGGVAFLVLPSAIMRAMGGAWRDGLDWPWPVLLLGGLGLSFCMLLGLSAVQLFVVHGQGTPIPLDHTKRLVRTGLYAYFTNPMQTSTALAWLILGLLLGNVWVAAAAVMAVVFVLGMVRWHHRYDLALRFPLGWAVYRQQVPDWLPRWRPWIPVPAQLSFDPANAAQTRLTEWLQRQAQGLVITPGARLTYREPGEERNFQGVAATAKALNHLHFGFALVGAALLLLVLPIQAIPGWLKRGRTRLELLGRCG